MKINSNILLNATAGNEGGGGTPEATLTVVEHNRLIAAARKEEKDKLYPDVESWTARAKDAQAKVTELTAKVTSLESENAKLSEKLATITAASAANGQVDVSRVADEVAAKTEQRLKGIYESRLNELGATVANMGNENKSFRLERYKESKIREAGGEDVLVVSLISGSTEAEIDASIGRAHDEYKRIFKRTTGKDFVPDDGSQNNGNGNGHQNPGAGAPPALSPAAAATPTNGVPGRSNGLSPVRTMSTKEYGANRAALKAATANHYKPQS